MDYPKAALSDTFSGEPDANDAFIDEDQDDDVEINVCTVCDRPYEGRMVCQKCQKYCHYSNQCSVLLNDSNGGHEMICQLCHRTELISRERCGAHQSPKKQADKMISCTVKKFKPANEGDKVLVPVPDIDRGRAEFRNVAGIITSVEENGSYTIGTNQGVLKQKYTRAEFIPTFVASCLLGWTQL